MKAWQLLSALLLLQIAAVMGLHAQTPSLEVDHNLMGWYYQVGSYRLTEKWGVSNEFHFRRANVLTHWQQFIFRPGVNYHLNPKTKLSVGYSMIRTYPYGKWPIQGEDSEHNVWGQLLLKSNAHRTSITHRLRLEERWTGVLGIDGTQVSGFSYSSRFRYRFTMKVPLVSDSSEWSIKFFTETWLNLGKVHLPVGLNQQRLFAALDYKPIPSMTFELGMLQQWLPRSANRFENNLALQAGCLLDFDFRKNPG